jgi:hypothetical protein
MKIIIMKGNPIFLEFEIIVFERNIIIIRERLLKIEFRVVAFKVLDDGILGVVRVEIGVREDVFDVMAFFV